jgi:hypothetical protein|tara:strand:- start:1327 stop:2502 length:1176 start_codon:yes stop_codon:yes gene_type:complete
MKLKILTIFRFLQSIKSIFLINLYIILKKLFNKNFKVIFFYFPVKSYQDNILDLIDELSKEKNFKVILGYNLGSSNEVKNYHNAFFLNLGYLKYLKNIDIFLSSYVVYSFPKTSNKIYINHDIYDTPMVHPKNENSLINALNKCNYIFLSSDIAINTLEKKFNDYENTEGLQKKALLINTGYLKLDHIYQKLKKDILIEDSILLAPTLSSMYEEYNLDEYLVSIIEKLLDNTKFKIIYRPHPGDKSNMEKASIIKKIYEKYKNNENFILDINTSYLESYKRSRILITDFSGTAYTYAFSKLRPIIFFSKNEDKLKKSNFNDLYFFKDRLNVGIIGQNIENLNEEIYSIDKQIDFFSNKIEQLRSKRIKYFNSSIEQNLLNIKKILNIKKNK